MELNNLDKLAKTVKSNILDKLDYIEDFKLKSKSCLIILPNISLGFDEYYKYIIRNYPGYDIYLSSNLKSSQALTRNLNGIRYLNYDFKDADFMNTLEEVQTIFILGLKISQMKSLSMAEDLEDINHIILECAMLNKSVHILLNTNNIIFNKIVHTIKDIRNIGIQVTNIQQNTESIKERNQLISESYVLNLRDNGLKSIFLSKKQIVTPLAKDKLRELNINVEYLKEEKE